MDKQVDVPISVNVYDRLKPLAGGFDTPSTVIEKLLDFYESHQTIQKENVTSPDLEESTSLDIVFYPNDKVEFKSLLIAKKIAWVKLTMVDGSTVLKMWEANKFTEDSHLMGNLRSGYLRKWKTKKIVKAEISIEKHHLI